MKIKKIIFSALVILGFTSFSGIANAGCGKLVIAEQNWASAELMANVDKIISIAKQSKVDAIHPGYGFLSENAEFVKKLDKEKIIFIGPNPKAIKKMGDKIESKNLAIKLKLNVIPGHTAPVKSSKEALSIYFF